VRPAEAARIWAHRSLTTLHASDEVFHVPEADPREVRFDMKSWRLESETAELFTPENSSEVLQIKDVVDFTFLRSGSYTGSPEEHE
jgi:hypothetical protein